MFYEHVKSLIIIIVSISFNPLLYSQSIEYKSEVYQNTVYDNNIKTVRLFPENKESEIPVIQLNTTQKLQLSFDDLNAHSNPYTLTIEYCDANWKPSALSYLDYATAYNEDQITDINFSSGTLQKYTHYKYSFPNERIQPKLAGNYILNVYKDNNQKNLIFTRRFYVVKTEGTTEVKVIPSPNLERIDKNQKLNLVFKTNLPISNPQQNLQIHVLQNQRPDNKQIVKTPSNISNKEFRYEGINMLDFAGNNEFDYVDLRTIEGGSGQIKSISRDSLTTMRLFPNSINENKTYQSKNDNNGKYFIRNSQDLNPDIHSDYINVIFSLQTAQKINGYLYIVGEFNDFKRESVNKLIYNSQLELWQVELKLKQGVYDYTYVLENEAGNLIMDFYADSFFLTKNDYQVFVYVRKSGTNWDELVDFKTIAVNN